MKPPNIPVADVRQLTPIFTITVPADFRDANDHMNMRYYQYIYDEAGDVLAAQFGLTPDYYTAHRSGGFDLEHHIHYLKEVRIGEAVSIYSRLVARSAKRVHYLLFMVNDTHDTLASIFECVNSFADLTTRRTAPYPHEIAANIDRILADHQKLIWSAPVCGVMNA